MRLALALVLCGGVAVAAPKHGQPAPKPAAAERAAPTFDELLAQFKRAPGLSAKFHEEKHLAMLEAPLVTEGTIHFAPPRRLARRAEKPVASVLLIEGDKLQFGDADGKQSVDLATNPAARLFVDAFVELLAGDRAGLEKLFSIAFAPRRGGAWRVTLTPRVAPMDKVIKELALSGDGLALREMDLRETSGDWTHTTFSDVDVNHAYAPAELARVFRLPGK